MSSERVAWVDIAKYVAMIFVIASHFDNSPYLFRAVYLPVYLTTFYFCSGYVYKHTTCFKKFMYKKIRQLLIPWLVFSIITISLSYLISFNNSHNNFLQEVLWNFLQIRGKMDQMWFLSALFIYYIAIYCIMHIYHRKPASTKRIILLISFALVGLICYQLYMKLMPSDLFPWGSTALPWHLESVPYALFFMILGYLYKTKLEAITDKYNTVFIRSFITILYIVVLYLPIYLNLSNSLLTTTQEILGVTTLILWCKVVPQNRYISYIGQNTLLCFVLHFKVVSLLRWIFRRFFGALYQAILSSTLPASCVLILLSILVTLMLIPLIWVINAYCPSLIGRKRAHS